jgi:hypothetical protein
MKAYIESLDIDTGSVIVEYIDPYELKNIRIGLKVEYPINIDNVITSIRKHIPVSQFEEYKTMQTEISNPQNLDFIQNFVGTTIDIEPLTGFTDTVY